MEYIWKVDPLHSHIAFSVPHMVIADVAGFMKDFEITIRTTQLDFSDAKVIAEIKANSVYTNNEQRDQHLISPDFLDAEKFPTIRFISISFDKVADRKFQVTGNLTIKGKTLPVILEVDYTGQARDPWGNIRAGFKAKTVIRRTSFGLTWNQLLDNGAWLVGNEIKFSFQGEFIRNN
ncbi:MAG: YceI family protein [Raineya sp.]|nr:YceI family protein [Raineya sp.]